MSNKAILLIEDDEAILEGLKELLRIEDFNVVSASNGKLGLDYLQSCSDLPRLIILDLMMPVMDGFQFRKAQLANPKIRDIPVLVMSADGRVKTKQEILEVQEYIKKPIDIDLFVKTIRKYIF